MDRRTPRAETVGSLLQPAELLEARARHAEGVLSAAELTAVEDRAVLDAVALQEEVGMDVITDGEMRRRSWADARHHLRGVEPLLGSRAFPANPSMARIESEDSARVFPVVVHPIEPRSEHPLAQEYPFLHEHAHVRTKYTMPAPSYHRRYWSDDLSTAAYPRCEDFLAAVRDWLHGVAARLVAQGCTYIQLDAPSYGSLCDPDTRAFHAAAGRDVHEIIRRDAALDSSVFEGLDTTRAIHICRGNMPGAAWHSSGGYGAIADDLFPNLTVDEVLLEYDSARAGDFSPLAALRDGTVAVLGLLTTKDAALEDRAALEARLAEAQKVRDLDELAISTQCGFASAANAPMTVEQERAKLRLVAEVAHTVWT